MPNQPNSLLVLAQTSFQGGNYAKALGFCESLLAQSPNELLAWILKGRCELRLPADASEAWHQSRASLLQAALLSRTDSEKMQVVAAWMTCFNELNATLKNHAAESLSSANSDATTSNLALAAAAASGLVSLRSKSSVGKVAGAAGLVGAAAAATHYSNQAKLARLGAVVAHFTRCEICADTLKFLESMRPLLAANFSSTAAAVLNTLPQALHDMAIAQRRLADREHLKSVNVSNFSCIGARYAPGATQLAVEQWIKLLADHQLEDQALTLIVNFSIAMGLPGNLPTLQAEVARNKQKFAEALLPLTLPPALLFSAFWLMECLLPVALRGITDVLMAAGMALSFIVGLYCAIKIDAVLKDYYPRFHQTRPQATVGLTIALTFSIFTGWYPLLVHKIWAHRAAINQTFLQRFPAATPQTF